MRIESLRMHNFGRFSDCTFQFGQGINLLYGPNFCGKSTAVNALFFALTGRSLTPRRTADDLTRAGEPRGFVGLTFSTGAERRQVHRSTRGEAQLREWDGVEWRRVWEEAKPVMQFLREQLGLREHRLAATAFLREGEISEFATRERADRRDLLHHLLGIDELLALRDLFIEVRRAAKRDEKGAVEHHKNLRLPTTGPAEEIPRLEQELSDLEKKLECLGEATAGGAAARVEELQRTRSVRQARLGVIEGELRDALGHFDSLAQMEYTLAEVREAQTQQTSLDEKRSALLTELAAVSENLDRATEERAILLQLRQEGREVCPTCHQPLSRDALASLVATLSEQIPGLQARRESLESSVNECSASLKTLAQLAEQQAALERRMERVARLSEEQVALTSELSEIATRLKGVAATGTSLEDKDRLRERAAATRARLTQLVADRAVAERTRQQLEQTAVKVQSATRHRLRTELACDAIDATLAALLEETLGPAEAETRRLLTRLQLFGGATVDLHTEHLLPVLADATWSRDLSALSGSEKMLLYISLKIALAKALGSVGFFVLDDPTLHLDEERKALLLGQLSQLAPDHQVILATNDPSVARALPSAQVIEVVG